MTLTKKVLNCANIGVIINEQDKQKNTPLHIAVKNDNHDMVKELIRHGAEYGIVNDDGMAVVVSEEKSTSESSSQRINNLPSSSPVVGGSEDTETFLTVDCFLDEIMATYKELISSAVS